MILQSTKFNEQEISILKEIYNTDKLFLSYALGPCKIHYTAASLAGKTKLIKSNNIIGVGITYYKTDKFTQNEYIKVLLQEDE
jgi:hypothetical protein